MADTNVIIVGRGQKDYPFLKNDMTVSREHCHLTPKGDGTYVLEDKSDGSTYVNGVPVCKTTVRLEDEVQLGESYRTKVKDLIPVSEMIYSIKPLEDVWKKYHDDRLALQRKQHGQGLLVRLPLLISTLMGAITVMFPEIKLFSIVFILLNLCLMVYGFIQQKNFVMADEMDKLDRWFQETYCCPKCHHFLGNVPYNILRQDKACKFCKCKLNDK